MLERMGIDKAQEMTSGDLVELANLIAFCDSAVTPEAYRHDVFEARRLALMDAAEACTAMALSMIMR
jgi:hypothetical protein